MSRPVDPYRVAPLETLAAVSLSVHGALALANGLRLRALHARSADPGTASLASLCLTGTVPPALLLLAVHLLGGAPVVMARASGRLLVTAVYLALGAGVVCTVLYVRAAFHAGGRALVAVAFAVGGFFVLEACVIPWLGYSIPALGLSLAHFPVQIAVYGWAAFASFAYAAHERSRPGGNAALVRRHRMMGVAFLLPALWVVSSFVLLRHPQLMGLGATLGIASQVLVWKAHPLRQHARAPAALPAR